MSENLRDQLQTTLGGAYTLERELGGGGMSRVFVAKDAALGREIVVKVLPHDTAVGVSAERFKREIQTAARLQHPHIVPLLSAGETGGLPFYTMPFVKGESLRARLSRSGELSVNEAIHVLRDIAAALAYAHGEGVVHRDIKPDNVILSGGVAVVTDFGVSKAVDVASTEDGGQSGLTSLGVALGTPAYMSPEQASADPHVDHRADIYSFGCVAYELLTGTSPFAGRPPQQMLAAHVKDEPESVLKRRPNVPPPLAFLVMKCLEKRAGDRPQSAEELLAALDAIGTPSGGMMPTGERLTAVGRSRSLWLGVAAAALIVGVGAVALLLTPAAASYSLGATYPIAITPEIEGQPAISPDGRLVAYVAATPVGNRVFVRQVEGGRANLLTAEIDGDHAWPHWSPDQQRISFAANSAIFVVPAMGGSPQRVIEGGPTHAWSRDGSQIVFELAGAIWTQSLVDGRRKRLAAGRSLHSPALSPSGHALAYVDGQRLTMNNVSAGAIWTMQVGDGKPTRVSDSTHVNASPVWTPDGRSLLYISTLAGSRDVYQQPVRDNGAPRGAPRRVTTALSSFTISLSADGSRMAYDAVSNHTNIWTVPIPARGAGSLSSARPITRENQRIEIMSVSKDGKWLAYDSDRAGNFDIYKLRLDGGEPIQLTTNPGNDFGPAWSPDGGEIAFHAHRSATRDIYVVSAEGGVERQVTSGPEEDQLPQWSPDGRKLVYYSVNPDDRWAAFAVSRDAQGNWSKPTRLTPETEIVPMARWSPNGAGLAYIRADSMRLAANAIGGDVVLLPITGGVARVLASSDVLGGSPQFLAWGPSTEVVFASVTDARGRISIWAVPTTGGAPRRILAEDATHRFGSAQFDADGARLYFTLAAWESDVKVAELKH